MGGSTLGNGHGATFDGNLEATGACIANLLKEAASWWQNALLWRTFFTTAVVAVVLRALIEYCRSGNCGLFGQGGLIMFDVSSTVASYSTSDLLAVLLLGIMGGLFGSLYNYLVDKVLHTYCIINEPWWSGSVCVTAMLLKNL